MGHVRERVAKLVRIQLGQAGLLAPAAAHELLAT